MSVHRVSKGSNNPYVMLDKRLLSDSRLSWKAKAILAYLLSKPDGWQFYENDLIKQSSDGKEALRSGIKELEGFGYLKRTKMRDVKGRFDFINYEVFETGTDFHPQTGFTATDNPTSENPPLSNNDFSKTERTNTGFAEKENPREEDKPIQHSSESPAFPSQEPLLTAPTTPLPPAVKSLTGGVGPRAALPADFYPIALHIWNNHKYEGWTKHTALSKRAKAALAELYKELGSEAEVGNCLRDAIAEARQDPYWQKIKGLTFENLSSNGKLLSLADKYRSAQPTQPALDPIWNPASFKEGMRVWYCSDIFAGKWDWATVVETNAGADHEPELNRGFIVSLRKRDGESLPVWNYDLAFKNPEET